MNRKILALAIPNIISNITIPLVGMADLAIVGHLDQDYLIGAMAIGVAIFNFIYWNFAFLRMGTTGLTAQAYGARDFREVAAVFVRSVGVALAVAVVLLLFRHGVGVLALKMMDGSSEVMQAAADYFYVRLWAAPATLSLFAFHGWFIGMQNSRFPMYISLVVNAVNVACGVWFVYGLGWGIEGVAWGTVTAQYVGLVVAVALMARYYSRFFRHIDLKESFDLRPMLHFFRVNRDIFLRTACVVIVYTFFTAASSGMGDTLLAVNTLLMQLFTLFSYMMDGFAFAAESLIGRYVGAHNKPMIQRALKRLLAWSGAVAVLYVGIYAFFWQDILGLFTSSPQIVQEAGRYIVWVILVPLIGFAPFLVDGALIGATATRVMRNSVFYSTVIFFALYYALRPLLGNDALWSAFIAFLVMRGVLQYTMTGRLRQLV